MNEHLTKTLTRSTTRRTIVRTGAKVAYAAPLVAVSYKLSQVGAMGASALCAGIDFQCDTATQCGTGGIGICFCDQGAGGSSNCLADVFCGSTPTCTTDGECGAGFVCSTNCCGRICVPICDAPFPNNLTQDTGNGRATGS